MKKGLIILLAVTLLFTLAATFGSSESIVVCSSMEQFRNDELQRQLNERFPDKNVIVMYMATGKALKSKNSLTLGLASQQNRKKRSCK